jgi:predicted heme/steroid binding protein
MRRARRILPLLALGALLLGARPARATEEYAACTAQPCAHCHESAAGGGALSAAGEAFARSLAGAAPAATTARRVARGAVLFVHVVTAFLWFGTILYVHLVLKPAYAARGLPRAELRLGWGGIVLIGATGAALTLWRVGSWHELFHTRFGVLLCVKIAVYAVMTTTAVLVTFVVGPRLGKRRARGPHPGRGDFAPEDLALFDGREGRQTFVAVDGRVHDFSGSRLWLDGAHMRRHAAGADLTAALAQAPHGAEKLEGFPVVGALVAPERPGRPPHERAFYVMAYLNLGLVALVLLAITLWHV